MTTDADRNIDIAINNIKEAIKNLSSIVIDECWGTTDLNKDYRDTVYNCMANLLTIKKQLDA